MGGIRKRIYDFNDDYFETIDSEDKAYFLGLLFADGNIYTARNRVQITLANEDSYILKAFANCIRYTGKLYIDREKYSKLILPSKKMCEDLTKLGCTPNKSLTLQFPTKVPKELIHHFIRGFFDGDGSITYGKSGTHCSFTSVESFLIPLSQILFQNNIHCSDFKKRYKDKEISAGTIFVGKKESQKNLYTFLYNDCNDFCLKRKKEKFDRVFIQKPIKKCSVCGEKHFGLGFCKKHYRRNRYELYNK